MRRWMIPLVGLLPLSAQAGYPDDVSLTQLATYDGSEVTDTAITGEAYETVVAQLAAGIANQPLLPAYTLGVSGFDISLNNRLTFLRADSDTGEDPTGWERMHADGSPARALWVPTLGVRKGLPFSLEVGGNLGYIAFSRQTAFGAYGRWGLLEGYRSMAPDLTLQVGYTGYVGNDELELGVTDMSVTIGYTWAFGQLADVHHGTFSPFLSFGLLAIRAEPRLSDADQTALGVHALPCYDTTDATTGNTTETCVDGLKPLELALGMQVQSNDAYARLGTAWSPVGLPTISFTMGLEY